MPGVDFRAIRAAVSIAQVFQLVDFQSRERSGDQLRGGWRGAWVVISKESVFLGESDQKHLSVFQVRIEGKRAGPLGRRHANAFVRGDHHALRKAQPQDALHPISPGAL